MTTIIFTKDRAMQLHAFLRSYAKHVTPITKVNVLYAATTERHALAYAEVDRQFGLDWGPNGFVRLVAQCASFKDTLLSLVPSEGTVVFFVDDQVFVRPWEVIEESGLSLRLGLNLTHDYAFGDAPQAIPPFKPIGNDRIRWRWSDGEKSWRYPLSTDGHVFSGAIRRMLEGLDFHSPNTLESALVARYQNEFLQQCGTCYRESKVVNVPWNLVQTDWHNRHSTEGFTPEVMLELWESRQQIDLRHIEDSTITSVHQEFPLVLEARC